MQLSFDRWIRPLGALLIGGFAFTGILLSFFVREIDNHNDNFFARSLNIAAKIENWFYDGRTARYLSHKEKSPHLVILEISDESLNQVGRWPWSREIDAKIVDHLASYGAQVVMFDVAFPEAENPRADKTFADAIARFVAKGKNHGIVLGYGITDDPKQAMKIPNQLLESSLNGKIGLNHMRGANFLDRFNFVAPELLHSGANFGFISADPDSDGSFRQYRLAFEQNGAFFPSLALAGFSLYYSDGNSHLVNLESESGTEDYHLKITTEKGEYTAEANPKSEVKIRFYGGEGAFVRVPIQELLQDKSPETNHSMQKIFRGKAVLIGSSAFAAHDLRNTPLDAQTPGMYLHANMFHSLGAHYFFASTPMSLLATLALFALGIIGVLVIRAIKHTSFSVLATALLCIGIYYADSYYFTPNGYFVRLFFCLFNTVALYAWFTLLDVTKENAEKKKIKNAFQRYVAPEIVEEMLSNPEKLKLGGEKKEITMIFSDVRSFTSISENLPPQQLAQLLNIYMSKMTKILFSSHGTLDKYIGDALVGFWGAPIDVPDHAYQGVKAALQMLEALPEVNREFQKLGFPEINIGIGLNTGEVSVGNMGSELFFQYTALGDNMNLASRLEGLTKFYKANLLISEFTYAKLEDKRKEFPIRPIDCVQVKGKNQLVNIYEVLASNSLWLKETNLLPRYLEIYHEFFLKHHYRETKEQFMNLMNSISDTALRESILMSDEALKNIFRICDEASENAQNSNKARFTEFEEK